MSPPIVFGVQKKRPRVLGSAYSLGVIQEIPILGTLECDEHLWQAWLGRAQTRSSLALVCSSDYFDLDARHELPSAADSLHALLAVNQQAHLSTRQRWQSLTQQGD